MAAKSKKIKDLDFSREDFGQRGKKKTLVASPKKSFDPLKNCDYKGFFWSYEQRSPSKYITYCDTQAKGGFSQRNYFNKN